MRTVYQEEFTGNPLSHDKAYVDAWYDRMRKPPS
jgi:hypothetical protein